MDDIDYTIERSFHLFLRFIKSSGLYRKYAFSFSVDKYCDIDSWEEYFLQNFRHCVNANKGRIDFCNKIIAPSAILADSNISFHWSAFSYYWHPLYLKFKDLEYKYERCKNITFQKNKISGLYSWL